MTTDELIAYYQSLLIIQYESLPNAGAVIAAFVSQVIANQIASTVQDGFNFAVDPIGIQPDSAIGVQLDAVGSYRGAQRQIYGLDLSRQYFKMPSYGAADADTDPGFALYGESPIGWFFLTYEDANKPIYTLRDEELYRLIQYLSKIQTTLLSVENVDDILFTFFGTNVGAFEDGDMHVTYIDLISDPDTLFSILNAGGYLPHPAGVRIDAIRSETLTKFFGFQFYGVADNPTFVGYGLYGTPQVGSFVRYP